MRKRVSVWCHKGYFLWYINKLNVVNKIHSSFKLTSFMDQGIIMKEVLNDKKNQALNPNYLSSLKKEITLKFNIFFRFKCKSIKFWVPDCDFSPHLDPFLTVWHCLVSHPFLLPNVWFERLRVLNPDL